MMSAASHCDWVATVPLLVVSKEIWWMSRVTPRFRRSIFRVSVQHISVVGAAFFGVECSIFRQKCCIIPYIKEG